MSVRLSALAATFAALPGLACACGAQLDLPAFEELQHEASDAVNLSLGPNTLGLAGLIAQNGGEADLAQLMHGVKAVNIRSYQFAGDGMYPEAAVDAVRQQLTAPGWVPLTRVRSQREGEKVDIYLCVAHDKVEGLTIIASERRSFTIVNVVGSIDVRRLGGLARQFGVPAAGS